MEKEINQKEMTQEASTLQKAPKKKQSNVEKKPKRKVMKTN